MSGNYLTEIIVFLLLYLTFITQCVRCEPSVTAMCDRPSVPPKARYFSQSINRRRFDNKEKVLIKCQQNEFPFIEHELVCNNGRWKGDTPLCGQIKVKNNTLFV